MSVLLRLFICSAYCSRLWWLNTSQHREVIFLANILWSVSIVQLTEAWKWQHAVFPTGHKDFRHCLCQAFPDMHKEECCLDHSKYIPNLQVLTSVKSWGLLLSFSSEFCKILSKATLCHSCIRLTTNLELSYMFILVVLWRLSSDKSADIFSHGKSSVILTQPV